MIPSSGEISAITRITPPLYLPKSRLYPYVLETFPPKAIFLPKRKWKPKTVYPGFLLEGESHSIMSVVPVTTVSAVVTGRWVLMESMDIGMRW